MVGYDDGSGFAPAIEFDGVRVFHGDCREVLKGLPDNSVHSIVTDPPYELGFMGKKWDSTGIAYDVTVWAECLRVLKPGGHILAFGGSRTWHRLAVAVEDAGFELRDSIAWLYGSGFPKSLDVSKAIDKNNGETGRKFKFTKWMRTVGLTARQIDEITKTNMGGHYLTDKSQPAIPTAELWAVLRPHCGDVPEWVDELVARVEAEREVIGQKMSGIADKNEKGRHTIGASKAVEVDITAPATPEAQKWQGWGTALKPAFEPIVVGRKPLGGNTVAENVLEWGVGGLNIDVSRIGNENSKITGMKSLGVMHDDNWNPKEIDAKIVHGRWPANVILDEVTAGLLDEQSGHLHGSGNKSDNGVGKDNAYDASAYEVSYQGRALRDYGKAGGGASRFFYVAKASKRDRNEGLEDSNRHPTVKPTQLMRYLIKLVTPPGGTVLDPFTGSGSTGKAAILDGFGFIGAELTEDYLPIIEGRLKWAMENRKTDETLF